MADRDYTGQAIGIFELDGLLACYVALDAAAKAANITVQGVERNRLKSGACVKIRGGIADVRAALDAALAAAEGLGNVTASTVIPAPAAGTENCIAMTIGK